MHAPIAPFVDRPIALPYASEDGDCHLAHVYIPTGMGGPVEARIAECVEDGVIRVTADEYGRTFYASGKREQRHEARRRLIQIAAEVAADWYLLQPTEPAPTTLAGWSALSLPPSGYYGRVVALCPLGARVEIDMDAPLSGPDIDAARRAASDAVAQEGGAADTADVFLSL